MQTLVDDTHGAMAGLLIVDKGACIELKPKGTGWTGIVTFWMAFKDSILCLTTSRRGKGGWRLVARTTRIVTRSSMMLRFC